MKHIVIGTAGHVDHGKTRLIQALTGVDTDRLAEEKQRGITIELGFAQLTLPDGRQASIIDVPGHEKFVKTMMAGASGMDAALLIIAADEGVMPQTREHLDILQLLDIRAGILVVTKCDLVEPEQLEAVQEQIRSEMKGSFLEDAPMVSVSAVTGQGMEQLLQTIGALLSAVSGRDEGRPMRLSVDRSFQLEGFGGIAAGTLADGTVRVGDPVEIYPEQLTAAVRTLQNHNVGVEQALAGMRTAMSLTGVKRGAVERGAAIAEPDSMLVTSMLSVWLCVTPDCPYQIKNSSQLHLFHGTREVVCKLRLLDADKLTAGQSGYAQLKLAEPIAVRNGDRFLLRFFSPVLTVGGGVILDGQAVRSRRKHPPVLERLEALHSTDGTVRLLQRVRDAGVVPVSAQWLRRVCNETQEDFAGYAKPLLERGALVELSEGALVSETALEQRWQEVETLLAAYHEKYPLQPGMRAAELRGKAFPEKETPTDAIIARFVARERMHWENGYAFLWAFRPVFTQEHKIMQRKLLHYYRDAWFLAPNLRDVNEKFEGRGPIYPQVFANMCLNGLLVPLSPRYAVHHEAYQEALQIFRNLFETRQQVTLAEFRTAAGISRKYAQLFLERWDRDGICKRVGDARVLLRRGDA